MANKYLISQNPFKGAAAMIVRTLLQEPLKKWSGVELAHKLDMSQAWVNRVLTTLEGKSLLQRQLKGPESLTSMISSEQIIKQWVERYRITDNNFNFYLLCDGDPLKKLKKHSREFGFKFALTGYKAANLISKVVEGAPPMVYLWPEKSVVSGDFRKLLTKLENQGGFIPVLKEANIIILEPVQKEGVFLGSDIIDSIPVVSPLQLYLDLYWMDQGKFIIETLKTFWMERMNLNENF